MEPNSRASLDGLKIVAFESRRAKEMAELIRRYGGEPIVAPSMREVPLSENRAALDLVPQLQAGQFDLLILMTGVGTKALNKILLSQFSQPEIIAALGKAALVARGPKPTAALKELGLEPALVAPSPNTWRELLSALDGAMNLQGKRVAIQEYGIANPDLVAALERRGATVTSIPIYRWALPEDVAPLHAAVKTLIDGGAQVAVFTNGAQVDHLFRIAAIDEAADFLRAACQKIVIASVGPVCTEVLEQFSLTPDLEASPPKMGSLIAQLAASARALLTNKNS
jgi:uroporphyrinogen-III synthase